MKILHLCSEMYPLLKTGGLADVMGALPHAQQAIGEDVRVLMPCYPQVARQIGYSNVVCVRETFAGTVTIRQTHYHGLNIYLLDAPQCFAREGNPYHDPGYHDYIDNFRRFALLAYIGAQLAEGLDDWWGRADILHAHDWQTGLACAYLHYWQSPVKSVFTIHNIAYPGRFLARHLDEIELPRRMFATAGLEFLGEISYLKAGLYYADRITTVSPTYAREITSPLSGGGMHGLLADRAHEGRLRGILNGVDDAVWNPASDPLIAATFDAHDLQGKAANKTALQRAFALKEDKSALLMIMITRMAEQKGADLVLGIIDELMAHNVQLAILGSGDPALQHAFIDAAARHPGKIGVKIAYDEALSHQMMAGGDVILVPSRFEPCGLTQLYGLKYGTLPLVRRTGGLADTVIDSSPENLANGSATGFVFNHADFTGLHYACQQALTLWAQPEQWQRVREAAMHSDFGWARAARDYQALYQETLNG